MQFGLEPVEWRAHDQQQSHGAGVERIDRGRISARNQAQQPDRRRVASVVKRTSGQPEHWCRSDDGEGKGRGGMRAGAKSSNAGHAKEALATAVGWQMHVGCVDGQERGMSD